MIPREFSRKIRNIFSKMLELKEIMSYLLKFLFEKINKLQRKKKTKSWNSNGEKESKKQSKNMRY